MKDLQTDWLEWIRKVQSIAQTGLAYTEGEYDRQRYQQLRKLALTMLEHHVGLSAGRGLKLYENEVGPATPRCDVRAAIFQHGKVLLVRETSDGLWSLPGGWADVGEGPAQSAVRETYEESGYRTRATKLVSVYLRDRHHPPIAYSSIRMHFLCEIVGGEPVKSLETSEIGFFDLDQLPDLSTGRIQAWQIHRAFEHLLHPELPTEFE